MNHPLLDTFAIRTIEQHDMAVERFGSAVCASNHEVYARFAKLPPECRAVALECIRLVAGDVLAGAFLTVSELAESGEWSVSVGGKPLSDLTPGLHYELFGDDDDWMHRFSKYGGRPKAG